MPKAHTCCAEDPGGTAVLEGKDGDIFRLGRLEKSESAEMLADLHAGRRGVFFTTQGA